MSSMFSSPKMPNPEPPPRSPVFDEVKKRERDAAAAGAYGDLMAGGRRSTTFAGNEMALDEQQERVRRRREAGA